METSGDIRQKSIENLTLVTAYFDLTKHETRCREKTNDNYVKWGDFLFSLNINMVFFVEKELEAHVWKRRKAHNLLHKTLILRREFSELKMAGIESDLNEYRKENPLLNATSGKDSSKYYILIYNKFYFVEEAIKLNPFNTSHYGWIDFGIRNVIEGHVPKNIYKTLTPKTDKVSILSLRSTFAHELEDLKEYAKMFRWKVAGGYWVGSKANILSFINSFKTYLHIFLSLRLFAAEEGIIAVIIHHQPELFRLYYGSYRNILINHDKLNEKHSVIFENLRSCRINEQYDWGLRIAEALYQGCYDKLSVEEKLQLLDEASIMYYYNDDIDEEISDFLKIFEKELDSNLKLRSLVLKNTRIMENLSFFDIKIEDESKMLTPKVIIIKNEVISQEFSVEDKSIVSNA